MHIMSRLPEPECAAWPSTARRADIEDASTTGKGEKAHAGMAGEWATSYLPGP